MLSLSKALARLGLSSVLALTCWALSGDAQAAAPRVDMSHARIGKTSVTAPTTQGEAVLTLDPNLQRDVTQLVLRSRAKEAAAVVIDVRTGKILAWVSIPPSGGKDRVAHPQAPPASIFKVVTAAALLDRAHVPPSAKQCYVGGERRVNLEDLHTQGKDGVKCSTFATALGYSRNLVMAGLALRHLKPATIRATAQDLGVVGEVPINVEVGSGSVLIPSDELGLARAAAGFGKGQLTPLGAAFMMATIANDGKTTPLSLIDSFRGPKGERLSPPPAQGFAQRVLSPYTASMLTQMLEVTVREGTAAKAFRDKSGRRYLGRMQVAGKTGTLIRGNPRRLYSWYAGFAPANDPQIAVAVMLANDMAWWSKGNQVARDVFRAYFARKKRAGVTHPLLGTASR